MKKNYLFILFLTVSLFLSADTEKAPLINYKCDSSRSFQIRKINDDEVEIRSRYSVARLKKDTNASSEIYSNRNYELGLLNDDAYLNIFGYFPAWYDDFYTYNRNRWNSNTYINEQYRGCKISE